MGMFDSLHDRHGNEWQTKAYDCLLHVYQIGDSLPHGDQLDYQVEVLGGPASEPSRDAYATIRGGVLAAVPDARDASLPLIDYHGHPVPQPRTQGAGEHAAQAPTRHNHMTRDIKPHGLCPACDESTGKWWTSARRNPTP